MKKFRCPFLSCVMLVVLAFCMPSTMSALAETPALDSDPGWGPLLQNVKCNYGYAYKCTSAPCSVLIVSNGSVIFHSKFVDVSMYLSYTIVGAFVPNTWYMYTCIGEYTGHDCRTHGASCGEFKVVAGNCSNGVAVGKTISTAVGWQSTCDNPQ